MLHSVLNDGQSPVLDVEVGYPWVCSIQVDGHSMEVMGGTGLQASKLVDHGLAGLPGEECVDDIHVNDIRKGVASLGEPMDVIL